MSDRPITSKDLHAALSRIAASMQGAAAELNAAGGSLGDGDLGITVSRGFAEAAAVEIPEDIGLAFMECAKAMQRVSSSSYGTLLAMAAMSAAQATKGRSEILPKRLPKQPQDPRRAGDRRGGESAALTLSCASCRILDREVNADAADRAHCVRRVADRCPCRSFEPFFSGML